MQPTAELSICRAMFSLRPILSLALCSALPACTAIPATNVAPSPISAGQPSVSSALLPPYKAQVVGTVTSIEVAPDEPPPVNCPKLPPRPWVISGCPKALQIVTINPDPDTCYPTARFATMESTKFYIQGPDGLHRATIADV